MITRFLGDAARSEAKPSGAEEEEHPLSGATTQRFEHFRHHARFYGALLIGLVVAAFNGSLRWPPPPHHALLAGDAFFAAYLALALHAASDATADGMRRRARYDDEGVWFILIFTGLAFALSLGAIFALLREHDAGAKDPVMIATAAGSVLLGWLTLHTVMAFRYAHLYYKRRNPKHEEKHEDAAVLAFPGTDEPQIWDFLYYAVVVGMTAQVSDVQTCSTRVRRTTLLHGLASFFFNTVILALAVNIAVS